MSTKQKALEVMQETESSATVLARIWERFESQYQKKLRAKPSKQRYAKALGFTANALSVWMQDGADLRRRIPVGSISALRDALLMSQQEYDDLMYARLMELGAHEEVMEAANWAVSRVVERDQGETFVVSVFRNVLDNYPRGLSLDAEEERVLHKFFEALLKRAQRVQEAEDEAERILEQEQGLDQAQLKALRDQSLGQISAIIEQMNLGKPSNDPWQKSVYRVALEDASVNRQRKLLTQSKRKKDQP